jgi:hypothetical protein
VRLECIDGRDSGGFRRPAWMAFISFTLATSSLNKSFRIPGIRSQNQVQLKCAILLI